MSTHNRERKEKPIQFLKDVLRERIQGGLKEADSALADNTALINLLVDGMHDYLIESAEDDEDDAAENGDDSRPAKLCPQCNEAELRMEVRGHDNRSVESNVYIVCANCGYLSGPFKL